MPLAPAAAQPTDLLALISPRADLLRTETPAAPV